MKRLIAIGLLALLSLQSTEPAFATRRAGGRREARRRTVVVVHPGWPLRRPLRTVIVHPARVAFRVPPASFLPVTVWTGSMVATGPTSEMLVWQDGETLERADDWTEFTLNCDSQGSKLWLQVVAGRAQFDWAEVVFDNGDALVVDMSNRERGPGYFDLLEFREGRRVDHVRVVARARTPEARVVLKMEEH